VEVEGYEPVNTLKEIANNIWIVDGPIIEFDFFARRVPVPTRLTIVRLCEGILWVHSPTERTQKLKQEIDGLGPVRCLIAPNRIHYWWIGDWERAYPEAMTYAAPGVQERSKKHRTRFDVDLGETPELVWANEMDQLLVVGKFLTEVVFFHRPSRTLILADLIENFEASKVRSRWLRLLFRLKLLRLTFFFHRAELLRAVRTMSRWEPEGIIIAHGRWYRENAIAELMRAFCWLGDLRE